MKSKHLLLFCIAAILFSSCSKDYAPALYHQDIAYQPKPASFDSVKSATYASGGINFYTNPNVSDFLSSAQFNLSRGYVFNGFNVAYGAFGVLGNYDNGTIQKGQPNYFTDKFFGAVGGRASINFFVNQGRADFRFFGIEAAYSHEFGSYASFRQQVQGQKNVSVDPRTDLLTVGFTTELLFHNVNDTHFQNGIRLFLGTTFGQADEDYMDFPFGVPKEGGTWNLVPKVSYFMQVKQFIWTVEAGGNFMVRFGYKF